VLRSGTEVVHAVQRGDRSPTPEKFQNGMSSLGGYQSFYILFLFRPDLFDVPHRSDIEKTYVLYFIVATDLSISFALSNIHRLNVAIAFDVFVFRFLTVDAMQCCDYAPIDPINSGISKSFE
jgi:hypothetical protein